MFINNFLTCDEAVMIAFMYLLVIGSAAFVYWDTAKNKIGKITGVKALTNASPLIWAIGVLLVWIIAFPLYLVKRKGLIQKAKESPVEVSPKARKITLAGLVGLFLIVLIGNFSGGNGKLVSQVKNGTMEGYSQTTIGKAFKASFNRGKWRQFEGDKGENIVEFTGKISKSLHADYANWVLANPLGQIPILQHGRLRMKYEKVEGLNSELLNKLNQKYGCAFSFGSVRCESSESQDQYNREVAEYDVQRTWLPGTPVTFQWVVHPDGESFSLENVQSDAWEGLTVDEVFFFVYL